MSLSTTRANRIGFWLFAFVVVVAMGVRVVETVQAINDQECWAFKMIEGGGQLETVFPRKGDCERFRVAMMVRVCEKRPDPGRCYEASVGIATCEPVPCVVKDDGDSDTEEES